MNAPQHGRHRVSVVVAILVAAATGLAGFAIGYGLGGIAPAAGPPGGGGTGTPVPLGTGSSPGAPGVVVVREDGDDGAVGDAAAPWRTLAHALASIPQDTVVELGPGTFEAADVVAPGTRIRGAGDRTVVTGGLVIRADRVAVSDLVLTGQEAPYRGGITVAGARGAVIERTVVRGNPFGVYLDDAREALVVDNRITDNGYGIEVHGATDGTVVRGNAIVDNDRSLDASRGAGGINLYFTTGGIAITGNRIADNDEVAIEIYAASDLDIRDNRVSGSNDMIESGTEGGIPCRAVSITANTFFSARPDDANEERGVYLRCASDAVVEWNTFAGLDRFAIGLYAGEGGFNGPLEDVRVRHNILSGGRAYSLDSALGPGVTVDENLVMPCRSGGCPVLGRDVAFVAMAGTGTRLWSEYQAWTGFDANGRFADPGFLDVAANDYRLADGSPAAGFAGATEAPAGSTSAAP